MIYKFEPILKTLVWGTENWVLSGVKGNETKVSGGPMDGKSVNELYGKEFPLLIKFIDAKRDLSIQVHPDDEVAFRRHGCRGKTEMWYIIGAAPGAHLLSGMSREISPEQYEAMVGDGSIVDALARHEVAPGDVFFLPAGRVHAICGGCYLAEVQETSDITYRIFDYNRPGLDGKPRQLHTQEAKDVIDYKVYPSYKTEYRRVRNAGMPVVSCKHFTSTVYDLDSPLDVDLRPLASVSGNFLVVIALEGEGMIKGEEGEALSVKAGQAALLLGDETVRFDPLSSCLKLMTAHL